MIDERHEELASLYALDLLEGTERAEFERSLSADAALAVLVRELRSTSAAFAHAAPPASVPPELKSRVLASVDRAASDHVIRPPVSVFQAVLPWAIAAGFALAAAWFGRLYVARLTESEQLRTQVALTEVELKATRQQLEAERIIGREQLAQLDLANCKISALASLLKDSPEAMAVAVWNPVKQEGVLAVDKMPPLAANQTLELWVIENKDNAKPVSAGVLQFAGGAPRVVFKSTAPVGAVKAFAVSRERNDGARAHAQPGEVILFGPTH